MASKSKPSMAEKRKRRAKRLPPRPVTGKPVNLTASPNTPSTLPPLQQQDTATAKQTTTTKQLAKDLLAAQRKSIDMLTLIQERVQGLPYDDIQQSLSTMGYYVVDGFLQDDTVVTELEQEGVTLLQGDHMEVDLENLGYGEYICAIQGGEGQYKLCPRSVELVVSITKYLPPLLVHQNLASSACMATLRTYDRKAHLASLELLTGHRTEDSSVFPNRPFGKVASSDDDVRKLSLLYYPISDAWDSQTGVTFQNNDDTSPTWTTLVPAKRDRLVFFLSDTSFYRKEPWVGKDGLDVASCIELHLVTNNTSNK